MCAFGFGYNFGYGWIRVWIRLHILDTRFLYTESCFWIRFWIRFGYFGYVLNTFWIRPNFEYVLDIFGYFWIRWLEFWIFLDTEILDFGYGFRILDTAIFNFGYGGVHTNQLHYPNVTCNCRRQCKYKCTCKSEHERITSMGDDN